MFEPKTILSFLLLSVIVVPVWGSETFRFQNPQAWIRIGSNDADSVKQCVDKVRADAKLRQRCKTEASAKCKTKSLCLSESFLDCVMVIIPPRAAEPQCSFSCEQCPPASAAIESSPNNKSEDQRTTNLKLKNNKR
ncbi:MAG: hypothetical protein HYS98_03530 [Deltaproteobacteria bacterium]|nr:hypothetical protein [Deltaproteobacteria bacterium]